MSEPALRLVRGDAAPEELAALLAVLAARGSGDASAHPPRAPQHGRWGDPGTALRGRLDPGPGAWVAAGWARRG